MKDAWLGGEEGGMESASLGPWLGTFDQSTICPAICSNPENQPLINDSLAWNSWPVSQPHCDCSAQLLISHLPQTHTPKRRSNHFSSLPSFLHLIYTFATTVLSGRNAPNPHLCLTLPQAFLKVPLLYPLLQKPPLIAPQVKAIFL